MKLRGLYAITDSQLLTGKFLSYVEAALDGGVTLLQYATKPVTTPAVCAKRPNCSNSANATRRG